MSKHPQSEVLGVPGRTATVEVEPKIDEIDGRRRLTAVGANAALYPETMQHLSDGDQALIRERFKEQLRAAMNAEARVRVFARWIDTYGLDALVGIFPGDVTDVLSSIGYVTYLMMEAKNSGLGKVDRAKIIAWHTLDAAVGIVPFLDTLIDYFISKANIRSRNIFESHTRKLIKQARELGISEEAIQDLQDATRRIEKKLGLIGSVTGAFSQDP